MISSNGSNLIEDITTPDVALLNVIESLVALLGEHINSVSVADLVTLSPVVGQVQLGNLRVSIPSIAGPVDNKGHIAAPLSEKSQALEMGLGQCSRTGYKENGQIRYSTC